ncbi:uncharacterized protein LOC132602549 [Lycium barbarum]|uniref:uncharacterized protein LOC132602549 n=1 Tax=Lycium barbarum TaxID=112863 RepID=UPI00293E9112|nr:uncharacterized protein LOC132602549 [Lycium barbarum]
MPKVQDYTIAFFEKKLTKSYIENDDFILSTNILDVLPKYDKEVAVVFNNDAFFMKYKFDAKARLNKGWKNFADAKGLKEGNELRFQVCDVEDHLTFIVHMEEIIDIDWVYLCLFLFKKLMYGLVCLIY